MRSRLIGGMPSSVRIVDTYRFAGLSRGEVLEESRKGVFSRAEHDRVRVGRRFVRQRGDVKAAEDDVRAARAVMVGDAVGAVGVGDVDLNDHQVGVIVEVQRLDVLVLKRDLEIGIEIRRQRRQTERREERVLDRSPVGAGGFGQRRQDQLHAPQRAQGGHDRYQYHK